MRILIATTQVPFISGGAEIQAQSLKGALEREGHLVEMLALPYMGSTNDMVVSLPYVRGLKLDNIHGNKIDIMIGLKFPSYLIPHSNKVIWLIHQERSAYDLWASGHSHLVSEPSGVAVRELIRRADNDSFLEARQIYTESKNVAKRLRRFNDIDAPVLYHPPKDEEKFYTSNPERFFFFPSRLAPLKRQDLVVSALSKTKNPVKLVLAGGHEGGCLERIQQLIHGLKLENRVEFLGKISDEKKLELYSKCLAVIYPPYDEDYGYVTLEGVLAGKAVITCTDSGGSLEFVQGGKTGWISEPSAECLARCLDEIWDSPEEARKRGVLGKELYHQMGISWKRVIEALCG